MTEALYYRKTDNNNVVCELCPHYCKIMPDKTGICRVRKNIDGTLYSLNYGVISSAALDPIEKKPLFNFMSGSYIFSIGSIGCNLGCLFCQNWNIAGAGESRLPEFGNNISPDLIVNIAIKKIIEGNIGIAYTYNEPTVWFEFMKDIATLAKAKGLKNVMVSNGYINPKPLADLLPLIDAFNIDLKGYSEKFYKEITKSTLNPVLETLKSIAKNGNHLEIAYLVIPGENDDPEEFEKIVHWIKDELGQNISLHINRYFPCHKLSKPPTTIEKLKELYDIADKILDNVYIGNI